MKKSKVLKLPKKDSHISISKRLKRLSMNLEDLSVLKERIPMDDKAVYIISNIIDNSEELLFKKGLDVYIYNGFYWERIDQDDLKLFLINCATQSGMDPIKSKTVKFGEILEKQFLYSVPAYAGQKPDDIKINVKNGTLTIKDGIPELKDFDKNDFFFYQLGFDFNPNAECKLFDDYLNYVLNDHDSQRTIYAFWAYSMMGRFAPKLEKMLVLVGRGGSGKSVIQEVTRGLFLDQNMSFVSLQKMGEKQGENLPPMDGKLVNYSSENNPRFDSELVKQIISKEPITGRVMYKGPYTIKDIPSLIVNMNSYPRPSDNSGAFYRRLIILPFETQIPDDMIQTDLGKQIIKTELPGVLNRILQEMKMLTESENIPVSFESVKARERWLKSDDAIELWKECEAWRKDDDDLNDLKTVYDAYRAFCLEGNMKPIGYNKFSPTMRTKGYTIFEDRPYQINITKRDIKDETDEIEMVSDEDKQLPF